MKSTYFILKALLLVTLGLSSSSYAAEFNFTFAHVLAESTPPAKAAEKFKQEVEKNSAGRINITIRPAAQLGGDIEIIEQTQMNLVQIAIPPTGNLANFDSNMYLFDLPFLISDDYSMKKILDGEIGQKILEGLDKYNLKGINYWGAGFRSITNNIRPINTPNDLRNIKMRVLQAPTILATYRAWGANPTAMAFTEVYNGLQQGVVEGQENSIANIETSKFYEVQKYMTKTNHAYHTYAAIMNKRAWESLPPDLQKIVQEAFDHSRDYARELTHTYNKEVLKKLNNHMEIITLSEEGKQQFIEKSQTIYKQFENRISPELIKKAIAISQEK